MTDVVGLVNSIYPINYFSLPGVDHINYPDNFWWSSKLRFASVDATGFNYQAANNGGTRTSEILEIDLGRVREINYINFDVLRAPVDIRIEYDAISAPDRNAVWLPVSPIEGKPFDATVVFDANNRTSWLNAEFNFTDSKGNMAHARYLRITFTRRDEPWPTGNSSAFEWPVFVKHLRIGRYVAEYRDTVGPLLVQDTPTDRTTVALPSSDNETTHEARQQFVVPSTSVRMNQTPSMLGFGVLIQTAAQSPEFDQSETDQVVSIGWSLWDVTNPSAPVQLRVGTEVGAVTSGLSWLDWYLDDADVVAGDTTKLYELRVFSRNPLFCNTVFTHSPNTLSNRTLPGTVTFTNGSSLINTSVDTRSVVAVGDYIIRTDAPEQVFVVSAVTATSITINTAYSGASASGVTAATVFPFSEYNSTSGTYVEDASKNLVMRVWADIADEGRDVLGNAYRYITRRQLPPNVIDPTQAGWMSAPLPSPDAVEALYFDVRGTDAQTVERTLSVIEAIHIAPRTPGVRMNVYYTQQNLQGEEPVTTNDWDYLLWTPVQETYTLRRDEIIQLPQAFRAAFVKLEFTALNPLPYRLPTYPPLPPKVYRRFPTWVEDQFNNSLVRNVVEDWFLRNATPVETKILQSLADPILEFEYKQQEFLAALALGKISDSQIVNSGIVDVANKAIIDPTTASKIFVSFNNQYQNTLLLSVDNESLLGQAVIQRFDPTIITDPNERTAPSVVDGDVPLVSTTNNRVGESYQNLAQVPMRFNKTTRHVYTQEQAEFNKKAYFVGIEKVRFLRNDYTVVHDDALILDNLYDDVMLSENTFMREEGTQIPDGAVLYVSYSINPDITDEKIFLKGFAPVQLSVGGAPARNVLVFDQPNQQGIQYFQDQDYELSYGTDELGNRITFIQRSSFGERLTVPLQPVVYLDAGTVIGHGVIPSPPTDDAAVVTGIGVVSSSDGPFVPDYGAGTYGGGSYADLTVHTTDSATVVSIGVPSSVESRTEDDTGTVIGVAVISATGSYNGGLNP